jgi:shikimate kinase
MRLANIILIGMPFSGKSTIAKYLSEKLSWTYVDTDQLVEENYLLSTQSLLNCSQIVQKHGESYFRSLENRAIRQINPLIQSIISTGGGCIMEQMNGNILRELGEVYYLNTTAHVLWKRMVGTELPSFWDEENPKDFLTSLLKIRTSHYEKTAHQIIDAEDKKYTEIADKIIHRHFKTEPLKIENPVWQATHLVKYSV